MFPPDVRNHNRSGYHVEGDTNHKIWALQGLPFVLYGANDLLYFEDPVDCLLRLVVPAKFEKQIFEVAHDGANNLGFYRTYHRIVSTLYFRNLSCLLKKYIAKCPWCDLLQTRRHAPYGELLRVQFEPVLFHTITIDLVVALPLNDDHNAILTGTCKFSKRVSAIPGQDTWTTREWAEALVTHLMLLEWGMPHSIISDRDAKFLSDFWRAIFQRLGVTLFISTAWHPQSDGQSERTNAVIEVAIRYCVTKPGSDGNWKAKLPEITSQINNSVYSVTGRTPNEIVYGFKVNEELQDH